MTQVYTAVMMSVSVVTIAVGTMVDPMSLGVTLATKNISEVAPAAIAPATGATINASQ